MRKFFFILVVFSLFLISCDNCYNVAEEKKDMQKLIWVNADGDLVDLTSGNYGITEWNGFSGTELNIQSQQVPFHDGSVYLDGLLSERELSVTLAIDAKNDLEKRYRLRCELIEILNPKMGEGYLIYHNDFTSKRIKCVPQIPLFENCNSNDSGTPKASLAWTACDPYWEDLEENKLTINDYGTFVIENGGDKECSLKLHGLGDFSFFEIRNQTTGKYIHIDNINNENFVDIDTEFGKKEIFVGKERFKYVMGNGDSWGSAVGNNIYMLVTKNVIYRIDKNKNVDIIKNTISEISEGYCLAYINNMWIILGNYGGVLTSIDNGETWTLRHKEQENTYSFRSICYSENDNLYCAVGSNSVIATSSDLENWTFRTAPISNYHQNYNLYTVMYKKNKFVAKSNYKIIITSTDAIDWNIVMDESGSTTLGKFIFNNDDELFIIGAPESKIYYSSNGSNWNYTIVSGVPNNFSCSDIAYGGGIYLVGSFTIYKLRSLNLTAERCFNLNGAVNEYVFGEFLFSFNSGIIVAIRTTANMKDFSTLVYIFKKGNDYVGYGNGYFIRTDNESSPQYMISKDLTNWDFKGTPPDVCSCILSHEGYTYWIGGHKIYRSQDLETWEVVFEQPLERTLNCIVCGYQRPLGFMFYVVGDGCLVSSSSGTAWSNNYSFAANNISIAFGAGTFAFVTATGGVYVRREDTISWEQFVNAPVYNYTSIAFGNDVFVAVAKNGKIATGKLQSSATGNIMFEAESPVEDDLTSVVFYKGCFYASCVDGKIIKSISGYDWSIVQDYPIIKNLAVGGDKLVGITGNYSQGSVVMSYEKENIKNYINNLSEDSDMSLSLVKGENRLKITTDANINNNTNEITYRQKYIGV